ncbi:hypothetical protein PAPHI01_0066 [Pancytospora philotis]|nr:hypothetical protein PAPHI01_0066 [Pancytospora philotis]
MLAWPWLVWQLPACCVSNKALQKLNVPVYTCVDYTGFGDAEIATLSALEVQMLSPLCQYCIKHDNPEIKPAVDDARLDGVAADDKIRMVLHSVLYRHARDPHFLAQQAGAIDYASHKLLLKLFGDDFIKKFTGGTAHGNLELQLLLVNLVKKYPRAIKEIHHILSTELPRWDAIEPTQYIERDRATSKDDHDLMIWLFGIELHRNISLITFFERLMGMLPGDPDRLDRLIPIASEFVRIVHSPPSIFGNDEKLHLEHVVVDYVISERKQVCFELLRAILDNKIVSQFVNERIKMMISDNDIDHEFLLMFARYISTEFPRPDAPLHRLFELFLPPTPAFHEDTKIPWNSVPCYFNEISYMTLRGMFVEMYDNPNDPARQGRMENYMEMLRFGVFVDVLKGVEFSERTRLAKFMVLHMNEKRKEEYRRILRQSRSDQHVPRIISVFDTIDLALSPS